MGLCSRGCLYLNLSFLLLMTGWQGCTGLEEAVGINSLNVPPELRQSEVIVYAFDDPQMYQAPRSSYDVGDLQNFQSQHTLPVLVEGAFQQIFGKVDLKENEPPAGIETSAPNVPAIFEVRLLDISSDVYFQDADSYRSQCMLAVAMKSPKGNVFWQKAFRGEGYVKVDPQWSTGLGPQDAVIDAVRDAVTQMQHSIITAPEVLNQIKYYQASTAAAQKTDQATP